LALEPGRISRPSSGGSASGCTSCSATTSEKVQESRMPGDRSTSTAATVVVSAPRWGAFHGAVPLPCGGRGVIRKRPGSMTEKWPAQSSRLSSAATATWAA
jgi:hypothetical protein